MYHGDTSNPRRPKAYFQSLLKNSLYLSVDIYNPGRVKANRDIDGIRDSRIEGELIAFISGENYYNRTLEFVGKACRIRKAALG